MELLKPKKEFVDKITLNNQKGEFYKVKLENDDNLYVGIPVICADCAGDDLKFSMKITQPPEAANRTIVESISKIEHMVRYS
jgi:hypothetical protein